MDFFFGFVLFVLSFFFLFVMGCSGGCGYDGVGNFGYDGGSGCGHGYDDVGDCGYDGGSGYDGIGGCGFFLYFICL